MKKSKIKVVITKKIESIPYVGVFVLYILRVLKLYFYYKPRFFINQSKNKETDIFKVYWINPSLIRYISEGNFDKRTAIGKIKSGNWDIPKKKFDGLPLYKSLMDRFVKKSRWEDTEYYQTVLKNLEIGKMPWMCKTKEEFHQRLSNLDALFHRIKENGFSDDPQEMLDVYSYKEKLLRNASNNQRFLDYISIDLSRKGEPLFVDGRHRLSIAKILCLDSVPIIVRVRHKRWAKLKQELKEYAKTHQRERLYQKAYHFDLEDIPYRYNEERVDIVKKHTSLKEKTVLDIGAYFGLFCHELEKVGFDCWAIETNVPRVYFMKKLRAANNDKFKIVNASIFEFKKEEPIDFDIILAINIFHHFLKYKQDYEKLIDFLKRLRCKEMFFESHNPNEKQMVGAYKNYSPEEFAKFIIKNSCLEKYKLLQEFENGRKFYKIFKS